jgi:tetratricopeptide (TPR) repeat protein
MRISFLRSAVWTFSFAFGVVAVFAPVTHAQMGQRQSPSAPTTPTTVNSVSDQLHILTEVDARSNADIDPREQKAYDGFFRAEDADKKIQMGTAFLAKYPKSVYAEAVDSALTNAYYDKQDWKNFYEAANNALALRPDDVDVLTTVGWVIPHFYNPQADGAAKQLDQAEACEKSAIQILNTMTKPAGVSDAQFAAAKAQKSVQAHSALGLVYFRRGDYANSVTQLHMSTDNNPHPDPTDLFILGRDLQNLDRSSEALDAFGRCGQIAGPMQDRCKDSADQAKSLAAQPKQ